MPTWNGPESDDAVRWFADSEGLTVFTGVPVTGPELDGWTTDCQLRTADVGVRTGGPSEVRPYEQEAFRAAMATDEDAYLIEHRGYADRPVFGFLATRQAYLARTWRPVGPVLPVALVRSGSDQPNVASAYAAAGFAIHAVPGDSRNGARRSGGGPGGRNDPWESPSRGEDTLLHALWEQRDRLGWWLAEVPIGFQSGFTDASARRVDAVVVSLPGCRHSRGGADLEAFGEAVAEGLDVELIEAKTRLNYSTIGQLLCGAHQFSESWPGHGRLSLTACVADNGDEAARWFCNRFGIRIEVVDQGT